MILKLLGYLMKITSFLSLLFILAFAVRAMVFCGYLSHEERYWQVDSHTYHQVATRIVNGQGITNGDGTSHFYRVPGYPIFLAGCYKFFGESKLAALWVQVFLASFIPLFIFLLSLSLFPGQFVLAQICCLVSVFHLGLVLYGGFFMTETLFILLFLCFLLCFVRAIKKNKVWIHIAAGIFLGLASLVRPVGHYLIVVAVLVLLLSRIPWATRLKQSIVLVGSWFAVVSCWLIRNYLLTGVLFFHTLPGGHFLYLSAARVAMQVHGVSYQEARNGLEKQVRATIVECEKELGETIPEIEACKIHERLAIKYFLIRPWVTLRCWLTDMFRASFSLYSAELLFLESGRKQVAYFDQGHGLYGMVKRYVFPETQNWWLRLIVYLEIIYFLVILLGFAGFILTGFRWCSGYREVLCNTLPFIVLFLVIALAGGYARMRLPIESLMIILSCGYILRLIRASN